MEAVSLSNRALLTEVIPTARAEERRERKPRREEGQLWRSLADALTLTQTQTQCPPQSWAVTGPWHCPGMSTMFAKPSISNSLSLLKQELLFETRTCSVCHLTQFHQIIFLKMKQRILFTTCFISHYFPPISGSTKQVCMSGQVSSLQFRDISGPYRW